MLSAPDDLAVTLLVEVTRGRLESLRRPSITNHRSQVVGEIRPVFSLTRFDPPHTLAEAR